MCLGATYAQRTVVGSVTDDSGAPLIGATVLVKNTTAGTVTDIDGQYSINVPAGESTLEISYIGYNTREIELGASNVVNVTLSEGVTLETAVVTSLGISKDRKALGYSVEQVGGEDLVSSRETNVVNALAGKVSGVQITNSGGQTGSSSRIVIRGVSSFLGENQPLFVIDGVPVDNSMTFGGGQASINGTGQGDSPLFFGGTSNRMVDLDPSIIENVSILKGASATALYGKRGANGVVLITTKSGKRNQKPTVNFSFSQGWQNARTPEFQDKYAQGLNGTFNPMSNSSWGPRMDTLRFDENGNVDPNGTAAEKFDNVKEFFQTGTIRDASISLGGGNEKSTYFFSYSNRDEKGILYKNDLQRHNFLGKFGSTFGDNLTVNASFSYNRTDLSSITEGNGRQAYQWTVYGAPISYDLRNDNGDGEIGPEDYLLEDGTQRLYRTARNNPYFLLDQNGLESVVNRFLPNIMVEYAFTPKLKLTNRLGADIYSDTRKYREAVGTVGTFPSGRLYDDVINYRQINNDLTLRFEDDLNEDFGLSLLVGHNINDRYDDRVFAQGVSLSIPGFYNIQNAETVSSIQYFNQGRLIGLYGSAEVSFRRYLYLTLTGRNDWSSTLPKDNNSFFYPSAGLSFVLTDAIPALQGNNVLSYLKLRGSWAQVGNDTDPYNTTETVYVQSSVGDGQRGAINSPYNGVNGFNLSNIIGNPNLVAELTSEVEFGLESQFFGNRIRLEASYYDRTSQDQIFNAPVAASVGAISRIVNAGSMRNNGIEILLSLTPVKVGGFEWNVTGTYTKNNNTIEDLTEGVDNIRLAGFTSPGIYIVKDEGYGVIWGSRYLRNEDGQVIIDDDPNSERYGLPLGLENNLGVIGNTQIDWFGSIRNTFSYSTNNFGSISLSAVLDKREGGDILNLDNFYLNSYGVTKVTENRETASFVFPNGVKSDGAVNDIEVRQDEEYWREKWGLAQEDWVEDGSFIRLREVTLRYGMPTTMFNNTTAIKNLSLFVSGRNLWLNAPNFTGADPEVSLYGNANGQGFYNFNTPGTVGWTVGLNATF
jgi:TonB-linked SusC/RagA family outer membrane protein